MNQENQSNPHCYSRSSLQTRLPFSISVNTKFPTNICSDNANKSATMQSTQIYNLSSNKENLQISPTIPFSPKEFVLEKDSSSISPNPFARSSVANPKFSFNTSLNDERRGKIKSKWENLDLIKNVRNQISTKTESIANLVESKNPVTNNNKSFFKNIKRFNSLCESVENSRPIMALSMGENREKITEESVDMDSIKEVEKEFKIPLFLKNQNKKIESFKEPCIDDFIMGECKGEGRFGKVFFAVHKKTGFVCGMKKIKKELVKNMIEQFIQEMKIQLFLNHPKLVKMYGYFCDSDYIYMLVEYMEEGSLYSLMKKQKKIPENEAIESIREICEGIKEMHGNNIVHRDLKPENIVRSHGVCKICDFGWAAVCEDRRQTYCGTLDYVCPEIAEGSTYDSGVDIWCIGILAYELMCGKAPFFDISRQRTIEKIKICKIEAFPEHLSPAAIKFIEMILQKNPEERVGVESLLESSFLCADSN